MRLSGRPVTAAETAERRDGAIAVAPSILSAECQRNHHMLWPSVLRYGHSDGSTVPPCRPSGRAVMPTPSAPPDATPGPAPPFRTEGTDAVANDFEAERQRLGEILGRMPDHVILFGRDERIEYVNPAMARDLGVPAETLTGRLPAELGFGGPELDPFRLEFRRVLETGEPVTGEATDPGLWGGRSYSYTMTPLSGPDGRVASVMLTSRDVTPLIGGSGSARRERGEVPEPGRARRRTGS